MKAVFGFPRLNENTEMCFCHLARVTEDNAWPALESEGVIGLLSESISTNVVETIEIEN
jgi:hypothetical protein